MNRRVIYVYDHPAGSCCPAARSALWSSLLHIANIACVRGTDLRARVIPDQAVRAQPPQNVLRRCEGSFTGIVQTSPTAKLSAKPLNCSAIAAEEKEDFMNPFVKSEVANIEGFFSSCSK